MNAPTNHPRQANHERNTRGLLSALVVLFLTTAHATAAASSGQRAQADFAAVDAFVRAELERARVPGGAVAIVQAGTVVHARGFGRADPRGRAMTPDTPVIVASVMKPVTAFAALRLKQAGKLDLDAPVRVYVPWFRTRDEASSARVTVRHLLQQTSGLDTRTGTWEITSRDTGEHAVDDAVRRLRRASLVSAPGTAFHYSNANYLLLAAVLERAAGKPFEAVVHDEVFTPLGMRNATANPALARGLAAGHRYWFGYPLPYPHAPLPRAYAAAGFTAMSTSDLARFVAALLNRGRVGTRQVLAESLVREMFTPPREIEPDPAHWNATYALGWFVRTRDGQPEAFHMGDTPNFHTDVRLSLQQGRGVVIVQNANAALHPASAVTATLAERLQQRFLDGAPPARDRHGASSPWLYWSFVGVFIALPAAYAVAVRRTRRARPWLAALDFTLVAVVLFALPASFGVSFRTLLVFQPDAGTLGLLTVTLAVTRGGLLLRALGSRLAARGTAAPRAPGAAARHGSSRTQG